MATSSAWKKEKVADWGLSFDEEREGAAAVAVGGAEVEVEATGRVA